ncbi:uncharacterized protein LOC108829269 [Raphanus sativus]|uniref:Uncharacterized protein LOC108829269 n=1 Tax=Raphanus sativus TaxID=3726 RepID=A0A6J0LF01_RAPSA|nr:uncharacterized protein LOC108829269 [Raphanus sativus]
MQEQDHNQDLNQQYYEQADPTNIIWKALQDLNLGANRSPWSVHEDAQREFEKDHRLCLVAQGLNPQHQNGPGIKVTLPRTWQLVGKVEGQVNDDDSVNFYFTSEHHLLNVLEKQPYTYRGLIVALDRWSHMGSLTYLRQIPFRVRIYNLPNIYRRQGIVYSIGSRLGQVGDVSIIEPRNNREAKVWVNILFDVDDVITLKRSIEIIKNKPPVELEFRYMGLLKFCTLCGSLKHAFDVCNESAHMSQRQYELMDIGTNPYMTAQERKEAIDEYKTIREVGESSGSVLPMITDAAHYEASEATVGHLVQVQGNQAHQGTESTLTSQEDLPTSQEDHGTKRKSMEGAEDTAQDSAKRLETEHPNNGLAVLLKPQDRP